MAQAAMPQAIFDVKLTYFVNKVKIIREVRVLTGLALKEAKAAVKGYIYI